MRKSVNDSYIGRIYPSNSYGDFKIIREMIPFGYRDGERVFEVEFIDTGCRVSVTLSTILHGSVKDTYVKNVYGIGSLGDIRYIHKNEVRRYYSTWSNMLKRCYNTRDSSYARCGALGVTVDPSWLTFSNFYNDIKYLYGYTNKLIYPDEFVLDKDYSQQDIPKSERIYSKNTCMWISKLESAMISSKENSSHGFYGVKKAYGGYYYTTIHSKIYARYDSIYPAAALFNTLYPYIGLDKEDHPFNTLKFYNKGIYGFTVKELVGLNKFSSLSEDHQDPLQRVISVYRIK